MFPFGLIIIRVGAGEEILAVQFQSVLVGPLTTCFPFGSLNSLRLVEKSACRAIHCNEGGGARQ